jgi:hypothetical protein
MQQSVSTTLVQRWDTHKERLQKVTLLIPGRSGDRTHSNCNAWFLSATCNSIVANPHFTKRNVKFLASIQYSVGSNKMPTVFNRNLNRMPGNYVLLGMGLGSTNIYALMKFSIH